MSFNLATGVYTAASGATSAVAGQTIASATWNSIFTDLQTALTQLGQGKLNGALPFGGSVSTYSCYALTVALSVTADTGITVPLPILASTSSTPVSSYQVVKVLLGNYQGTNTGVTVGLYTAANQGGTTIITSTAVTLGTSVLGNANSLQVITPASTNTVAISASTLFFCVVHNNGGVAGSSFDVNVHISPVF